MNSLGDLILPRAIVPRARWQNRKQVISEMAAVMAEVGRLEPKQVIEALLERERLGSTGVGEGVAIPHARVEGLERPIGGFAHLLDPVDFEAIDERKADLVFMLLAPTDSGAEHLRALARVARVFRQEQVRVALRRAQTADVVLSILSPDRTIDAA